MKRLVAVCSLVVALLLATGAAPALANQYDGCVKYEATVTYKPSILSAYTTLTTGYLYVSWPADHSLPATGIGINSPNWYHNAEPYGDHNIEAANGYRSGFRMFGAGGYSDVHQYDFWVSGIHHQCKWFGYQAIGGPDGYSLYSVTWIFTSY